MPDVVKYACKKIRLKISRHTTAQRYYEKREKVFDVYNTIKYRV